jgi:methyl-accepting chemotaxis protein
MNFDEARQKHAEWRVKFRSAITKKETLDPAAIAKDDRCDLGKWLHGEAKARYSALPAYSECVQRHAHFHVEASKVAEQINAAKYEEAQALLAMGSAFSKASASIGTALDRLEQSAGSGSGSGA